MSKTKTRLLIASQDTARRACWARRLANTYVVCEVSDLEALHRFLRKQHPELLVLDMSPCLGGLSGLSRIRCSSPSTKTLVLTDAPAEDEGVEVLKAGAKGYYMRYLELPHLQKAVDAIQKGEIWIQRTLIPSLIRALTSPTANGDGHSVSDPPQGDVIEGLTTRQRLVAELIGSGASNKEIASKLNISERTVKAHLTEVFRTIGVQDRLHLALLLNRRSRSPHPSLVPELGYASQRQDNGLVK